MDALLQPLHSSPIHSDTKAGPRQADGDTQIEMVCCESDPLFHVHVLHVLLQLFAEALHTYNFQSPLHSLMYNFHFLHHLHNCVSNH